MFTKIVKRTVETYQEEPEGTFTHDGEEYDLNAVLKAVEHQETIEIDIDQLDWVLDYDTPDEDRLEAADTDAPIVVAIRMTVVDGLHRLAKAKKEGKLTLKTKLISDFELEKFKK